MLCGIFQIVNVAVVIELQIMRIPMLTQNQCTINLSAHDERPGHGRGQIPCILGLCFFRQTDSYAFKESHSSIVLIKIELCLLSASQKQHCLYRE